MSPPYTNTTFGPQYMDMVVGKIGWETNLNNDETRKNIACFFPHWDTSSWTEGSQPQAGAIAGAILLLRDADLYPELLGTLGFSSIHSMRKHAATCNDETLVVFLTGCGERGQMILPLSPTVTEVGLCLCMKNFLQKDTPERLHRTTLLAVVLRGQTFRKYVPLHSSESSLDRLCQRTHQ